MGAICYFSTLGHCPPPPTLLYGQRRLCYLYPLFMSLYICKVVQSPFSNSKSELSPWSLSRRSDELRFS